MLPEVTTRKIYIDKNITGARYVSLYRENATRLQLKLLKDYLCDESAPLKLNTQENTSKNAREVLKIDIQDCAELKKYKTIDHIPKINKYHDERAYKDENHSVQSSMKKLSELINESSLPLIKKYVKKCKMGVAEKLLTYKIR